MKGFVGVTDNEKMAEGSWLKAQGKKRGNGESEKRRS